MASGKASMKIQPLIYTQSLSALSLSPSRTVLLISSSLLPVPRIDFLPLTISSFPSLTLSLAVSLSLGRNTEDEEKLRQQNKALELVKTVTEVGLFEIPDVRT